MVGKTGSTFLLIAGSVLAACAMAEPPRKPS
jgi:hypothetical protein